VVAGDTVTVRTLFAERVMPALPARCGLRASRSLGPRARRRPDRGPTTSSPQP